MTARNTLTTIVSSHEIADRLGVKPQTVHMWQWRGLLPAPDWSLRIGPVWRWERIEEWAEATGRL